MNENEAQELAGRVNAELRNMQSPAPEYTAGDAQSDVVMCGWDADPVQLAQVHDYVHAVFAAEASKRATGTEHS